MEDIVNKVKQSGLIQIDLESLRPAGERVFFDIAPQLYMGLALREKDFRTFIQTHDWAQYDGKHVAIACSEDAIIPTWAYMLVSSSLTNHAATIVFGNLADLEKTLFDQVIQHMDLAEFEDGKIVIKGCSKEAVPLDAYVTLTNRLRPIARSIFFGEPCSTVPIYKKAK
ncbi:DUF2480 family protein [Aquirufa regiilacus]|jgi:hypothetical protein|uniref:DUF2480 family protein n=1 Tax=Aquirufa regiilacus TaxID=3024868 RepID=A0ABU3TSK9_9BACT|nr:DUF2480 family protein [Aquirufa sp. LEOWEIH-7C]MDU0808855.1 DUF2480 family protein [Aquirufa sp. LEOWEIH-7C]